MTRPKVKNYFKNVVRLTSCSFHLYYVDRVSVCAMPSYLTRYNDTSQHSQHAQVSNMPSYQLHCKKMLRDFSVSHYATENASLPLAI